MAYQFRLEKIRHLREQERHLAQWKYTEVLHKLQDAESRLSEALAKERQAAQLRASHIEQAQSVQNIQDYQTYLDTVNQISKRYELQRDRIQQKVETEQQRFQQTRMTEKMMNKLRDTDYANYRLAEARKDQEQLDEIVVSRYGRNS